MAETIRIVQKGLLEVHRRFILMHLFYVERLIGWEAEKGEEGRKVYRSITGWIYREAGCPKRLETGGF